MINFEDIVQNIIKFQCNDDGEIEIKFSDNGNIVELVLKPQTLNLRNVRTGSVASIYGPDKTNIEAAVNFIKGQTIYMDSI